VIGLTLALLAALSSQAGASPAPATEIAAVAAPVTGPVLRAGTPVPMRMVEPLSSKTARQGQRIPLEVVEDVRVDGHVVIPKASRAFGEVVRVSAASSFGKAGRLSVKPMFVEVAGHRILLDGAAAERGKKGLAPALLTAPVVGAVAAFVSGKSAVLEAGTRIDGFVRRDLVLRQARSTD
jgi:hypothetical protein